MTGETCGVAGCDRDPEESVVVTDRDGGGSPLPLCGPCHRAYHIARRDGGADRKYTEYELKEELVVLAKEYNDQGLAAFAVHQMLDDASKTFVRERMMGAP